MLRRPPVDVGQHVAVGQVIGQVGTSGHPPARIFQTPLPWRVQTGRPDRGGTCCTRQAR
ncbi:hypothetical protein V1633_30915 [Plantactinospora sonchi]|uniref:Peptidase M23 domain-containing protein n=1 Tax=Plantactinospora sonchi TaxID=1544735 RepID=A0ABU7S3A0_9ACTN